MNTQKLMKTMEKKEKEKNVIISMDKGHKEVLLFLQELNMGDYFDNFINNGITNKEKLLYLTNDNLKLINIPYAYRFRILKKLKESKNLENMKRNLNEKGKLSKIKIKQESKYEEIIIPKEEDDKEIDNEEMRKTFTQAIYDFQKTHSSFNDSIVNDNYDRSENNRYQNSMNDINYKDEEIDNINIGEEIENVVEKGEYIEDKNKKDKKIKELLPLNGKKILCYFCLKVILTKDCIKQYKKLFCSSNCLKEYENINYIKCIACSKKIKKIDSLPSFNNRNIYYCSLTCLEKIEPERKNWIKKTLIDDDEVPNSLIKDNISNENKIDILDL